MTFCALCLALLLDRCLGEPARYHPLVGLGHYISWIENRLRGASRVRGILAVSAVLLPALLLGGGLEQCIAGSWAALPVSAIVLYCCIGGRSLIEHAERIAIPLEQGDMPAARKALSYIVSRDTAPLNEEGIALAASESVLENGSDALFAALFWFMLAGIPGVLVYRAANTLDAMWGYRTPRYLQFGWCAARVDDMLNWIPARLTVLSYALASGTAQGFRRAFYCAWVQGRGWKSPNAGPVMAAGAGALNVQLGGGSVYHGQWQERPVLGMGHTPSARTLWAACRLVQHSVWVWLAGYALIAWISGEY